MQNLDYFCRLIAARILARANGFTNTEAALARLIDDHAESLKAAPPDWSLASVAVAQLKADVKKETII